MIMLMMKNGYKNEFDFIGVFNEKFIWQLDERYVRFLEDIYGKKFKKESYVICWKPLTNSKTDKVIKIEEDKRRISIKTGKNNSVHMEKLSSFVIFLNKLGLDDEVIELYKDFHYGLMDNGERIGSKEYQALYPEKSKKLNYYFNNYIDLTKVINRFLFEGIIDKVDIVDVMICGNPSEFKYVSKDDIINYLINYKGNFLAPHFSALVLQPWARNLNNNEKYEYKREYVQVKWYFLNDVFDKIGKKV